MVLIVKKKILTEKVSRDYVGEELSSVLKGSAPAGHVLECDTFGSGYTSVRGHRLVFPDV
jgi:hypothetical protein